MAALAACILIVRRQGALAGRDNTPPGDVTVKRTICLLVVVCLAGVMATALRAQDEPKAKAEQPAVKEGEGNREAAQVRLPEQAARVDKVVGFSEDQKKAIAELQRAREAAIREANAKFLAGVLALMTPEQKAKWDAAAKEGERRQGERREGERHEGEQPGARPGGERPVSAGSTAEGTAAEGMLVAKGEDWISVKAEGDKAGTRYTTDDKELIAAIGKLTVPSRVKVTFAREGEARRLVSVQAQSIATSGVVEGVVTAKGERWIEIKPLAGDGTAERYMTIGDARDVVAAIAGVGVGDKVRVTWKFIERKRAMKLEKLGAGE